MSAHSKIDATRLILASLRYERADAVLADVARMLDTPQHLEPCEDTYSSLEGGEFHEVKMLTFKGTVPIKFRGETYHTPLRIHVHPEHPHRAPIVHLEPMAAMTVKRDHDYVDSDGRVQVPYLRDWTSRCDLGGLVGSMISEFSEVPPLKAKLSGVCVESSSGGVGGGVSPEDEALRWAIEESQRLASRAIALASGGVDGERKSEESGSLRGGGGSSPGTSRHASGTHATSAAKAARGTLMESNRPPKTAESPSPFSSPLQSASEMPPSSPPDTQGEQLSKQEKHSERHRADGISTKTSKTMPRRGRDMPATNLARQVDEAAGKAGLRPFVGDFHDKQVYFKPFSKEWSASRKRELKALRMLEDTPGIAKLVDVLDEDESKKHREKQKRDLQDRTLARTMPMAVSLLVLEKYQDSLEEALSKGYLSPTTRLRIAERLCWTVCAMHSAGVFHGDLKEANVVLDNDWNPVLIDFETAEFLFVRIREDGNCINSPKPESAIVARRNAHEEVAASTPGYYTKKTKRNKKAIDFANDIFALGRILTSLALDPTVHSMLYPLEKDGRRIYDPRDPDVHTKAAVDRVLPPGTRPGQYAPRAIPQLEPLFRVACETFTRPSISAFHLALAVGSQSFTAEDASNLLLPSLPNGSSALTTRIVNFGADAMYNIHNIFDNICSSPAATVTFVAIATIFAAVWYLPADIQLSVVALFFLSVGTFLAFLVAFLVFFKALFGERPH